MERDLATFLTALYGIVDDFYQRHLRPQRPVWGGPPALMSEREGLCLGLAAPWRSGVPGKRERGSMREVRTHLRPVCPTRRTPRAFHRRRRRLWGAFLLLPDAVAAARAPADALAPADDEDVMDGFPLPVAHGARSCTPGWVAAMARIGTGGHDRDGDGVRMLRVLNPQGGATGWALASGPVQARWVAAWLCRTRAGGPGVPGSRAAQTHHPTVTPPTEGLAVWPSAGAVSHQPLLSASGFRGEDGLPHGAAAYAAHGGPLSKAAPHAQRRWGSSARQGVETPWAHWRESLGRTYPGAHPRWGLLMRVAAQVAA